MCTVGLAGEMSDVVETGVGDVAGDEPGATGADKALIASKIRTENLICDDLKL